MTVFLWLYVVLLLTTVAFAIYDVLVLSPLEQRLMTEIAAKNLTSGCI